MNKFTKSYVLLILAVTLFIFVLLFYTLPTFQFKFDKSKLKGKIFICRDKSFYLMNANGTNIRNINVNGYPILSSQAKKVAWIINKDSKIFGEKEMAILVMDIDGKNSKILEVNTDNGTLKKEIGDRALWLWGLRWAKNEEEITLYYRCFKKGPHYYKIAINVISGDSRIIKELSQTDNSDYEDYYSKDLDSPDETKTFAKADINAREGYLINKLSGKKSYFEIPCISCSLSWSPDSNKLVYATLGDIYTVNADGTNLRNLTNYKYPWYADHMSGRGGYEEPSWSPDSRYICCTYIKRIGIGLFTSPSYEIYIIDAITGMNIFLIKGQGPMWLPEEFNIPDTILLSGMLGR